MLELKSYFNIHSGAFPGGEIRGFLAPVPEPTTMLLLGSGLAAAALRLRGGGDSKRNGVSAAGQRSPAAEASSRTSVASGWRRRIDAGQARVTGPRTAAVIAARLAGPGTIATARGTRSRNGIVSESAVRGTSSRLAKQPSFTC